MIASPVDIATVQLVFFPVLKLRINYTISSYDSRSRLIASANGLIFGFSWGVYRFVGSTLLADMVARRLSLATRRILVDVVVV